MMKQAYVISGIIPKGLTASARRAYKWIGPVSIKIFRVWYALYEGERLANPEWALVHFRWYGIKYSAVCHVEKQNKNNWLFLQLFFCMREEEEEMLTEFQHFLDNFNENTFEERVKQ